VQRFDDPTTTIKVAVSQVFAVSLPGNPTTGYIWQPEIDGRYLELLGLEFEPGGEAIGSGGCEVFRFRALQAGQTEIAFEYRRPWGGPPGDTRHCPLVIVD
jgi:inhibitor of cysteine peptidase